MTGARRARPGDFDETFKNIEIEVELEITAEDLAVFHSRGAVSAYKRYALWEQEVRRRLPSLVGNVLSFTCVINRDGVQPLERRHPKAQQIHRRDDAAPPLHRHGAGYGAAPERPAPGPGPPDAAGGPYGFLYF